MKKYITLENKIYEAFPVLELNKINDEILPTNRKSGNGADKNQFFIPSLYFNTLEEFFPEVIKDRKANLTGVNKPTIKNYFDLTSLLNDLSKINNEISIHFKKESQIDLDDFYTMMSELSKSQNLNTSFYIESEIANAQNGIAFKNWDSNFKPIIKALLLPTTQVKVFLFKLDGETCAFWQFNQDYIYHSEENTYLTKPESIIQKIVFGAPGTGKSHKVKELIQGKEERTERVTFHPEYDYSSFVGGYKPTMDGENIRYEFVPQAFTNIYVKAWNDLEQDYYLVIEEINRGNCAEIFGDIFQLLDRTNEYRITPSKELKEFLKIELSGNKDIDAEKLLLPSNLHILATMNTSDQSLFPMDSAFKRRWDWEYIPINYEVSESNLSSEFNVQISETESFSWIQFIKAVNSMIKSNDNLGMDKCLGNYFIKPESKIIDLATFINKAVFYLWNDVFKDETEEYNIFKDKTTYEDFFPIQSKGTDKVKDILEVLKVDLNPS